MNGCQRRAVLPVLFYLSFVALFISDCQAVVLHLPHYTVQNVQTNQETIQNDFLLLETVLFDFFNIFTRPIQTVLSNKVSSKNHQNATYTSRTLPQSEESEIIEEIINVVKDLPSPTFAKQKHFRDLIRSANSLIGIQNCIDDLAKVIESTASALLTSTYCRFIGHNDTNFKQCFAYSQDNHQSAQILDAWGRPPAGIYSSGPLFWLGAYDQCLSLSKSKTVNQSVQYCRANVDVEANKIQQHKITLFYGMCLPATCNEQYIKEIFFIASRLLLKTFDISISNSTSVECFRSRVALFQKFGYAEGTIVLIAALILLVLCGTVFDFYRKPRNRKYSINKVPSSTLSHFTTRLAPSVHSMFSDTSSKFMPFLQEDAKSFIYTDAPSQALTYKSALAVRKTLKKPSCLINAILAFSARSSYHYLTRSSNRHLKSLHGIRVLSAFWVVLGHAHLLSLEYIGNVRQLWTSLNASKHLAQIILNSSLSVDSFLLLSGTILSYKVNFRAGQQNNRNRKSPFSVQSWLLVCLHRFMRLLPAYLILFVVMHNLFQYLGDGPMWSQQKGIFGARCHTDDFWRQLLFVSNYFPNECMPWMWYLALDTQFYIAAPIILSVLYSVPMIAIVLIILIISISIVYRVVVILFFRFPATLALALLESEGLATESLEKLFLYLYASPQSRIGPFLIGILLGWLLSKKPIRTFSTPHIDIMRFSSIAMISFAIFGAVYADKFNIFSVFYAATFRVIWAIGLSMLIWLCERGYMNPIQSCLAWNKWIIFSRLSYGFYLSHEPILLYFIWSRRSAMMPLSPSYFVVFALEITLLSLLAASIIAFVIEIPPLIIERKLFKTIRARVGSKKSSQDEKVDGANHQDIESIVHLNNKRLTELVPMLPPMSRTRQWVEENNRVESKNEFEPPFDGVIKLDAINKDHNSLKTEVANTKLNKDEEITTDENVSTCKTSSTISAKRKQKFQNDTLFCAPKKLVRKKELHGHAGILSNKSACKKNTVIEKDQALGMHESTSESIGFSWIEELTKKIKTEGNDKLMGSFSGSKIICKREVRQNSKCKQQQMYLNTVPEIEEIASKQSSSSTSTDETVIHVFKKHYLSEESNL